MNLSARVKSNRKRVGISQVALAAALNVSQSTVASWENGSRYPDVCTLCRMAEFFQVSTDSLLDIVPPSDPVADAVSAAFQHADPVTRGIICDILHVPHPQTKTNTVTA